MKAIVARGAGVVIVTLGENGRIAWDGAQFWRQAPEPVTVIDTMGAGDSFIAGFLCGFGNKLTEETGASVTYSISDEVVAVCILPLDRTEQHTGSGFS